MKESPSIGLARMGRKNLIEAYEEIMAAEARMAKTAILDVIHETHDAARLHAEKALTYYRNMTDETFAVKNGLEK